MKRKAGLESTGIWKVMRQLENMDKGFIDYRENHHSEIIFKENFTGFSKGDRTTYVRWCEQHIVLFVISLYWTTMVWNIR